ncbi:VOC family protein [Bacillus salipaludis]|uniref:VOC family protein n=1 Tax=Bacillus salipaludis TaxID=2547811 RepID=UPI002E224F2E|nr:VOC family protein [Bacillus salipaludis]
MLQLDHIIHFINRNPEEAVHKWEKYGLKAIRGGSHINWGTYNSLLYFGLSYIEYLAVEKPVVANQSENPLISQLLNDSKQFEGFGQICFRTSDIVRLKEDLKTKGYHPTEIFEGKRLRDDGVEISWKMLFIQHDGALPYPFFIQWNQNDQERLEDLKRSEMLPSRQENHSVKSISFVVSNVAQVVADWARLFGVPIESKNIIKVGRTDLVFHDKKNSEILTNIYKLKGDRPFQVEIDPPIAREPIIVFGDSLK